MAVSVFLSYTHGMTAAMQMPQLRGTDKQVRWAESLRTEFVAIVENPHDLPDGLQNETLQMMQMVTSAAWWIDQREMLSPRVSRKTVRLRRELRATLRPTVQDDAEDTW